MLLKNRIFNVFIKLLIFLIALTLSSVNNAFTIYGHDWQPTGAFSLGPGFPEDNKEETLSLLPPWTSTYTASNNHQVNGLLGLSLGAFTAIKNNFNLGLGLSAYYHSAISFQGDVWQFSLPEFDNFSYHYKVQSNRLMFTAKAFTTYKRLFHPYLMGEVGASFNRVYKYYERPYIVEAIPMTPFANARKSSFAWDIGFGVDFELQPTTFLGIGYQFIDNGKAKLNPSPAQRSSETLGLNNFNIHQLLLQLTVLL